MSLKGASIKDQRATVTRNFDKLLCFSTLSSVLIGVGVVSVPFPATLMTAMDFFNGVLVSVMKVAKDYWSTFG